MPWSIRCLACVTVLCALFACRKQLEVVDAPATARPHPPTSAADGGRVAAGSGAPRMMATAGMPARAAAAGAPGPAADGGRPAEPADDSDAGAADQPPDAPVREAPSASASLEVAETVVLAPLAGRMYTPAPGQSSIGFWGTDLGFSVRHRDALYFIFGDTWRNQQATTISPDADDTHGLVSLGDFPGADAVDAWLAAHAAPAGEPAWHAAAPPLTLLTRDGQLAPLLAYNDQRQIPLGVGRTPITAFSDGADGLFVLFLQLKPLACRAGCPEGYSCDSGLGTLLGAAGEGVLACVIGQDLGCAAPADSAGLCQDRSSSAYATTPEGRRLAVVYQFEFGNEDPSQPGKYVTETFDTNKFINPSMHTVADFDPRRRDGAGNVYAAASGKGANEKVFLWGRPWFLGSGRDGHSPRLYLAYFDLPKYSPAGRFGLQLHYFTELKDGVPQFSMLQSDARPLDLSNPGPDPTVEPWDVVGQHSVSWVEPLQKWVMFYGGDLSDLPIEAMGQSASAVLHDPEGAVHMRYADHPWGPWSAPLQVLKGSEADGSAASLPSAPRGILRRPDCTSPDCPPHESFYGADERGFLYGSNIIEPWTRATPDGADLYWNVSTWDPYQVVLLKTSLRRSQQQPSRLSRPPAFGGGR
jgi:hypothetical protein